MGDSKSDDIYKGVGGGSGGVDNNDDSESSKEGDDSKYSALEAMKEYCLSDGLENAFEDFCREQKDVFLKCLDLEPGDEHPIEFHNVYLDYLKRFEGKIERFIEGKNFKIIDLYRECSEILERDEVFGHNRFFVEALLATSEYESFYMLMRSEMFKYRK